MLFWIWKNAKDMGFYAKKQAKMVAAYHLNKTSLTNAEVMECAREPWEAAFSKPNILKAFSMTGYYPKLERWQGEGKGREESR